MKKKIGIITFHSAHNYGAMLQVYAMQEVLLKIGNEVEIINFRNKEIDKNYKIVSINTKNFKSFFKSIVLNIVSFTKRLKRYNAFNKFMKQKLNLSKEYRSENELKNDKINYDILITGSDQVWNSNITKGLQDSYTLNFGENGTKRISYAASIGNSSVGDEEKEIYKEKISKINFISVRENTAKTCLLNCGVDKEIEVVLDPTLLLTREEWENKILNKNNYQPYILAYVVEYDEDYVEILNYLSKITGLSVIHFLARNKYIDNELKSAYMNSPLDFVELIKNAEYIVCTSFHATIFSIIFNKKFWVIPHKKTGSRVIDLLDLLDLSHRAIYSVKEFDEKNFDENINYIEVNHKLKLEREKSLNWLNKAIES